MKVLVTYDYCTYLVVFNLILVHIDWSWGYLSSIISLSKLTHEKLRGVISLGLWHLVHRGLLLGGKR